MVSMMDQSTAPPILDFSAFQDSDPKVRANLISQIRQACEDKGFFQLTNHGIPFELQSQVMAACKQFFALSLEDKMKLDMKTSSYNRGYEAHGSQMLEAGSAPDSKEALYLGEHLPLDHPRVVAGEYNCGPNLWPEGLGDGFQETCMKYFYAVYNLANEVMKALTLGLGLEESWFDEFTTNAIGTLRFIHYPPTPRTSPKERGIGAHRDFGCVTLLMQDDVGGLQVQNEATGEWIDVKPTPGAYVVNLGNLMMRWTNHHYTSNLHRVLNFSLRDRYSIPFFFTGNPKYVFDCIPGCEDEDFKEGALGKTAKLSKYDPISVQDYMNYQFKSSYARAEEYKSGPVNVR